MLSLPRFLVSFVSVFSFVGLVMAQNVPLQPSVENGKRMVRWNVAAGTVQIMRSTTLAPGSWVPAPTPKLLGGDWWEVEAPTNETRVFYKADAPITPTLPPQNVRMVMDGNSFRLEWDSAHEAAGYVVYAGPDASVGPSNYERRVVLGNANSMLIEGLTNGQAYYITIAHINPAGTGPVAVARRAVFGPNGPVSGTTRRRTTNTAGRSFEVDAQGAQITLTPVAGGVGAFTPQSSSDERGAVHLPHVPVGEYYVDWVWGPGSGRRAGTIMVTPKGASFGILDVSPTSSGSALFGTLRMADGMLPAIDHEAFDVHLRATVTAIAAGGSQVSMPPDTHGRWLFQGLPPSAFPLTLRATLGSLMVEQVIASAPTQPQPVPLVFTQTPPRVKKIRMMQNGVEVQSVARGVPVTLQAELVNNENFTLNPRWTVEYAGTVQTFSTLSPAMTFEPPPAGSVSSPTATGQPKGDGGMIRVRMSPSDVSEDTSFFDRPINETSINLPASYSGRVGEWDPLLPEEVATSNDALVTITRSAQPNVTATTANFGYFEAPVHHTSDAPYTLRVEKEGFMRFFWPFSSQLPNDARFCLIKTQTSTHQLSLTENVVINYAGNGAKITLPPGSLRTAGNIPYTGDFTVALVSLDPGVRHPFPPGAEVHIPQSGADDVRIGMKWLGFFWISIKDLLGNPLTPGGGASLTLPVNITQGTPATLGLARQNDSTGWFDQLGQASLVNGPVAGIYTAPLSGNGLHIVHIGSEPNTISVEADRTLNYPFDVLIGGSFFPVTVRGLSTHSLGSFTLPSGQDVRMKVIDLKQGPGMHFADPGGSGTLEVPAFEKNQIVEKIITPNATTPSQTDAPSFATTFSLGDSVPELAPHTGVISGKSFFLSRQTNTKAESDAYYAKIKAPATLLEWRRLNGFPDAFGEAMSNVPVNRYATVYYNNLADLGFARAQTMRMRPGLNGILDVAYQVTNYPTLEDARLGRSAIATVCMDYAARFDDGESNPKRYTRFYVYDAAGFLIGGADLDGAGKKKFVPGSCTTCHGGEDYTAGGTTNLGARFLPFDMEAYSFHPKWRIDHEAFAKMNEAVLQTNTTAAITDLITGWYGTNTPTVQPMTYNIDHIPSGPNGWSGTTDEETMYRDAFKANCRVCHISRESGGPQFDSYDSFANGGYSFGAYSVDSLEMPHAQRTWSLFWGDRGNNLLKVTRNTDAPTLIMDAGGIGTPRPQP
jgi:hypothetical protein